MEKEEEIKAKQNQLTHPTRSLLYFLEVLYVTEPGEDRKKYKNKSRYGRDLKWGRRGIKDRKR